jgi:hypothetical protein
VEDEQLAAELLTRMDRDQQVRTEPPDIPAWLAVDADNTAWLEAVVDRQGWPLRSKVGEQAATAAWLLAQHADARPDFQRRCLQLLTDAVDQGEADPAHLAYLTDRVLCAEAAPSVTAPSSERPAQRRPPAGPAHRGFGPPRPAPGHSRLGPFADYERHMLETYGQDN